MNIDIANKSHRLVVDMYICGKTYQEIGDLFGVSRQRIHQITKRYNISRIDSPRVSIYKKVKSEIDALHRIRHNNSISDAYGIPHVRRMYYLSFSDNYKKTPLYTYATQKANAKKRKIEWLFNMDTWWSIWIDSGKWDSRGGILGGYVMARIKDKGPYSPDNVYITTHSQNIKDGYYFRRNK